MTADPKIAAVMRKWIRAECIDEATLKSHLAEDEYRQMNEAGTSTARSKRADENLGEIEKHARALSKAISAMPGRAKWAILEHRNSAGEAGTIAKWLSDLNAVREDVLLPLVHTAKGARRVLPARRGRGRARKTAASPRDALVSRLEAVYRESGSKGARHRGEDSAHAFVRDLLDIFAIALPDDLPRLLRGANKSRKI